MDVRTFFVTQDREKSTDSVEGGAAQESSPLIVTITLRHKYISYLHEQYITAMY